MAILTQKRSSVTSDAADGQLFIKDPVTGDFPRVDNSRPEEYASKLVPVAISPIKLTRLGKGEEGSSLKLLELAAKIGFEIQHLPFSVYGKNKQGKERYLSNSELVQGYPMYGKSSEQLDLRLSSLMKTRKLLIDFTSLLKAKAEKHSTPVQMDEWDDADKLTIQRTQFYGRFLALPASADLVIYHTQKGSLR